MLRECFFLNVLGNLSINRFHSHLRLQLKCKKKHKNRRFNNDTILFKTMQETQLKAQLITKEGS